MANPEMLADIADYADELCDGRVHIERIPTWDKQRNRKFREHRVTLPGLLAQLYDSVFDPFTSEDLGTGRPVPRSRAPLAIEALSVHTSITLAAARWCWSLRIPQRDTVERNIRALVGAAGGLDVDTVTALRAELRSWHIRASVMTGWRSPLFSPRVPCPRCERVNTLRVNLATSKAFCTHRGAVDCSAEWSADDGSIGVLAQYIREMVGGAP